MALRYILLIGSILLYLFSPISENTYYILCAFVIFIIDAYLLVNENVRNRDFFSFNIIFSIAFFLTSYCFPVFILNNDVLHDAFVELSTMSIGYIDFSYITKATSLCSVAYAIYVVAYKNDQIYSSAESFQTNLHSYRGKIRMFLNIGFFAEMANIIFTVRGGSRDFNINPFIYDIFPVLYCISLLSCSNVVEKNKGVIAFWHANRLPLIYATIVMLTFLFFGERGNAITLGLITLSYYSFYYKRMRIYSILIIGLLGVVLLFSIRETRNKDYSMATGGISSFSSASKDAISGLSPILMFSDLIGATQELCYGYETTYKDGLSYPSQIVILPFYPIPKMPSIVSNLIYDKEPGDLYGGSILNAKMSKSFESCFGSHIVIDIFMRWGLVGVLIAFFIFGRIVSFFMRNKYNYAFPAVVFLLIMGMSLYIARSSITDLIRPISYAYFFLYLTNKRLVKRYR